MIQLRSYLSFNGNCREAMNFYKACLGGELRIQPLGDSPQSMHMPARMKNAVLHAELRNDKLVLMGSDLCSETGLIKGNSVSLALDCSNETEAQTMFDKLSEGGSRHQPLQENYWGALFGSLTDQYGNHWLINHSKL